MSETFDDRDMAMSSGIAAFEAKQFTRAVRLLSPLAEEGEAEAQYRMAIMLQNGLGMVENPLLAFRYMRSAAEAGHVVVARRIVPDRRDSIVEQLEDQRLEAFAQTLVRRPGRRSAADPWHPDCGRWHSP